MRAAISRYVNSPQTISPRLVNIHFSQYAASIGIGVLRLEHRIVQMLHVKVNGQFQREPLEASVPPQPSRLWELVHHHHPHLREMPFACCTAPTWATPATTLHYASPPSRETG